MQEEEEAEKQPGRIKKTYVFRFFSPGMGIVCENANFCSSETDFLWRKKNVRGEEKLVVPKNQQNQQKGGIGFSSALNTHETYRVRSRVAIARLGC